MRTQVSLPGTWVQSLVRETKIPQAIQPEKTNKKTPLLVMNYHVKKGFRFYKL